MLAGICSLSSILLYLVMLTFMREAVNLVLKRDSWHFLLHVSSQLPIDPILFFLAVLFLLFLNSVPLLRVSILHVFVRFFLTFCPQLTLFSLHFMRKALLLIGYPFYANLLFVTVCESNTKSINDVRQHGVPGLRTHGHLIAKKSINLLRANSWSLLLAFNLKDNLLLIDSKLTSYFNTLGIQYLLNTVLMKTKPMTTVFPFIPLTAPFLLFLFLNLLWKISIMYYPRNLKITPLLDLMGGDHLKLSNCLTAFSWLYLMFTICASQRPLSFFLLLFLYYSYS